MARGCGVAPARSRARCCAGFRRRARLLGRRLGEATDWCRQQGLPNRIGYFGASTGAAAAKQLAADGWQVFAGCRAPDDAKELQKLAADSAGRIHVIPIDVTDTGSVRAAARALAGQPIDLLLNNAFGLWSAPLLGGAAAVPLWTPPAHRELERLASTADSARAGKCRQ
mgnify:CR=1 FL=1